MTYELYTKSIIEYLINLRAKESFKRHESTFYSPFLGDRQESSKLHSCYSLLPSRRSWAKVSENFRRTHNLTSTLEERLKLTLMADYESAVALGHYDGSLSYLERLTAFIDEGWERFNDYQIDSPKIAFIPKDATYSRAITLYKDIDRFNIGIWARRLTEKLEQTLCDSAVAFRGLDFRRAHSLNNHHQVFALLTRFWRSHYERGSDLWVAEADVKGFYDNVNKENVISYFTDHLYERPPSYLASYLSTYSFYDYLLREADRSCVKVKNYRSDVEALDPDFYPSNYGVPQGGALSCVIANLVFDPIDKAIEALASGRRLLYLRYCDDMILMSPDHSLVGDAFSLYNEMCEARFIPVHKASTITSYDRSFWSLKSKAPYRLGNCNGDVPWFSFLGYQMSHEGKLRMRAASIHKELTAQKQIVDEVLLNLHKGSLKECEQQQVPILAKLEARFYKRISGLVQSNKLKSGGFSWSNGFSLLADPLYTIETNQLKLLDRKKQKQLRRIVRRGHRMASFTSSYFAYIKGARYRAVRHIQDKSKLRGEI